MFPEMRRKDRLLPDEDVIQILREGTYGILSTLGKDGYPYGVPLSYAYEDGKIYFHGTSAGGLKTANIAFHSQVCFTVVGKTKVLPSKFGTKYESVIAFGHIQKAPDNFTVLHKILEKYCADYLESGDKYAHAADSKVNTYILTIDHLTGKARRNG